MKRDGVIINGVFYPVVSMRVCDYCGIGIKDDEVLLDPQNPQNGKDLCSKCWVEKMKEVLSNTDNK